MTAAGPVLLLLCLVARTNLYVQACGTAFLLYIPIRALAGQTASVQWREEHVTVITGEQLSSDSCYHHHCHFEGEF